MTFEQQFGLWLFGLIVSGAVILYFAHRMTRERANPLAVPRHDPIEPRGYLPPDPLAASGWATRSGAAGVSAAGVWPAPAPAASPAAVSAHGGRGLSTAPARRCPSRGRARAVDPPDLSLGGPTATSAARSGA